MTVCFIIINFVLFNHSCQFLSLLFLAVRDKPLQKLPYIEVPERPLGKLGFDEVCKQWLCMVLWRIF